LFVILMAGTVFSLDERQSSPYEPRASGKFMLTHTEHQGVAPNSNEYFWSENYYYDDENNWTDMNYKFMVGHNLGVRSYKVDKMYSRFEISYGDVNTSIHINDILCYLEYIEDHGTYIVELNQECLDSVNENLDGFNTFKLSWGGAPVTALPIIEGTLNPPSITP
jgi:hypothetical protein